MDFLESSLHGIEREMKVSRKGVCAAEWNDAKGAGGFAAFGDKSLEDLVDCSIASAREDDFRAGANSFAGLKGGGTGGGCWYELYAVAEVGKCGSDLAQCTFSEMSITARGRVIDEDTAHLFILRGGGSGLRNGLKVVFAQGLKPNLYFRPFAARLKSRPDTSCLSG